MLVRQLCVAATFAVALLAPTALVRDWIDGVEDDYGVVLTNPTPRLIGMYSREAPLDPALMPRLVIETVPEPGTGRLLGTGLAALAIRRRRSSAGGHR